MNRRTIACAALAASLGIVAVAQAADAAWKGITTFDCATSRAHWDFDGMYGPYTQRAVRNYQKASGLKVDGNAGPATYKALGLKYRRTLRCGQGGNDVYMLQQALAAKGFWYGGEGSDIHVAPTPRPTPAWTEPPVLYTPEPYTPTPEPVYATPKPMYGSPEPEPVPVPVPEEEVTNTPTLELHGGNWAMPLNAGSLNYDYTFVRPTWTGGGTLWLGDFGLGGEVTMFNQTFVDYRHSSLGPYFVQNTAMYDALAKWRFDHGFYNVFAGYRGMGTGNVNFGTLGLTMDRPLAGSWLWLQATAQGGHNFASSYFLDGRAGLGLRFNPLELRLGFRHFAFQNLKDPLFNSNGPLAEVRLAF